MTTNQPTTGQRRGLLSTRFGLRQSISRDIPGIAPKFTFSYPFKVGSPVANNLSLPDKNEKQQEQPQQLESISNLSSDFSSGIVRSPTFVSSMSDWSSDAVTVCASSSISSLSKHKFKSVLHPSQTPAYANSPSNPSLPTHPISNPPKRDIPKLRLTTSLIKEEHEDYLGLFNHNYTLSPIHDIACAPSPYSPHNVYSRVRPYRKEHGETTTTSRTRSTLADSDMNLAASLVFSATSKRRSVATTQSTRCTLMTAANNVAEVIQLHSDYEKLEGPEEPEGWPVLGLDRQVDDEPEYWDLYAADYEDHTGSDHTGSDQSVTPRILPSDCPDHKDPLTDKIFILSLTPSNAPPPSIIPNVDSQESEGTASWDEKPELLDLQSATPHIHKAASKRPAESQWDGSNKRANHGQGSDRKSGGSWRQTGGDKGVQRGSGFSGYEDGDGEEDSDGDEDVNGGDEDSGEEKVYHICPFYIYDPVKHSICLEHRHDSFSRVKQHIKRAHTNCCKRCKESFLTTKDLTAHSKTYCTPREGHVNGYIDKEIYKIISNRHPKQNLHVKYNNLYMILFRQDIPTGTQLSLPYPFIYETMAVVQRKLIAENINTLVSRIDSLQSSNIATPAFSHQLTETLLDILHLSPGRRRDLAILLEDAVKKGFEGSTPRVAPETAPEMFMRSNSRRSHLMEPSTGMPAGGEPRTPNTDVGGVSNVGSPVFIGNSRGRYSMGTGAPGEQGIIASRLRSQSQQNFNGLMVPGHLGCQSASAPVSPQQVCSNREFPVMPQQQQQHDMYFPDMVSDQDLFPRINASLLSQVSQAMSLPFITLTPDPATAPTNVSISDIYESTVPPLNNTVPLHPQDHDMTYSQMPFGGDFSEQRLQTQRNYDDDAEVNLALALQKSDFGEFNLFMTEGDN